VLQHRAAEMLISLEQGRSMAMLAAMMVEEPDPAERTHNIAMAKVGVGQAIEGHGGGACRDHRDHDPSQLPPRRQPSSGQHSSAQRKREREDRVLPLDHLERDLQISEKSHELIVKQRL